MAYYIGTKTKCNNYDNKVIIGENYVSGDNWANPIQHPTSGKWAILKHDNYTSEMILESELSSDWFPEIEI
tara:strand:+ start:49 stop:261 length:213 start_codon:yes stop_codon:yes gene_type:complete